MAKTLTKLLVILMAIVLCTGLITGCNGMLEVDEDHTNESSFVRVEDGDSYWIVYHKETKVMYIFSTGSYNAGSACLMLNADGTPMVWEGE